MGRYHVAEAFLACKKTPGADIFAEMDQEDYQLIRESVISLVLATDMKQHFGFVEILKVATGDKKRADEISFDKFTHKNMLMKMVMKASDIGHTAKPPALHKKWSLLVSEEFYRQGDKERAQGVKPFASMDRTLDATLPKGQIGFISLFALPLHNNMSLLCPELSYIRDYVHENIKMWGQYAVPDDDKKNDDSDAQQVDDSAESNNGKPEKISWDSAMEFKKEKLWREDLQPLNRLTIDTADDDLGEIDV